MSRKRITKEAVFEEVGDSKYKFEMSKKTNTTMLKLFPLGFIHIVALDKLVSLGHK